MVALGAIIQRPVDFEELGDLGYRELKLFQVAMPAEVVDIIAIYRARCILFEVTSAGHASS